MDELQARREALACWLNNVADYDRWRGMSDDWRDGYSRAVDDIWPYIAELVPEWVIAWKQGERLPPDLQTGESDDARGINGGH